MRRRGCYAAIAIGVGLIGWGASLELASAAERTVNPANFARSPERARPVLPTPPDVRIGLVLAGGRYAAISDDIADGLAVAIAEVRHTIGGHRIVVLREDGDGSAA